jgi:hypothetical protein
MNELSDLGPFDSPAEVYRTFSGLFPNEVVETPMDVLSLYKRDFQETISVSGYADKNICKRVSGIVTRTGERIARTVFRVAATRIFSRPEQSIMELPVNSIDSYGNGQPIGKFGMGFHSVLYWLCESVNGEYRRTLTIRTCYEHNNGLQSYSCQMEWTHRGLVVTVEPLELNRTGTTVTIDANEQEFTATNTELMMGYVQRLEFITGVSVLLNGKRVNSDDSQRTVDVRITPFLVRVEDHAAGIPYSVLINYVLVPGASTKTREFGRMTAPPSEIRPHRPNLSRLCVVVSGVCVFSNEIESTTSNSFIIQLPPNSRIPVSRDDVVFEAHSPEVMAFANGIREIMDELLMTTKNIRAFVELLKSYVRTNTSPYLSEVVYELIGSLSSTDYLFVPENEFWTLFSRMPRIRDRIVFYNASLISDAERKFMDVLDLFEHSSIVFKSRMVVALNEDSKYFRVGRVSGFSEIVFTKSMRPEDLNRCVFMNPNTLLIPMASPVQPSPMMNYPVDVQRAIDVLFMTYRKKLITIDGTSHLIGLEETVKLFMGVLPNPIKFFIILTARIADGHIVPVYGDEFTYKIGNSFYGGNWEYSPRAILTDSSMDAYVRIPFLDELLGEFFTDCYPTEFQSQYNTPDRHDFVFVSLDYRLVDEFEIVKRFAPGKGELFLINIILREIDRGLRLQENYPVSIKGVCLFILDEIRRIIDNETLESTIKTFYESRNPVLSANLSSRIILPATVSTDTYLRFRNTLLRETVIRNEDTVFVFSCKSIMAYAFSHDEIDFVAVSSEYTNTVPDLGIQLLEIAVNEGTTKAFIESVMTELVQNSMDAIRNNEANNRVDITTGVNSISVRDYIGIKNPVEVLIPFLSDKDPNDPRVIGEMGTGFFNVYRQPYTEYVTIETVVNGKHIMIKGTPIVNEYGYVVDIVYNFSELEPTPTVFTEITVVIRDDIELLSSLITESQLYVDNQLSCTRIASVYLNGVRNTVRTETIMTSDIGDVRYAETKVFPSFIVTNEVPLCRLVDAPITDARIMEFIGTHSLNSLIVTLNKNVYTPNQSRKKIVFKPEYVTQIYDLIWNGLIRHVFMLYVNNRIDNANAIIENTTSSATYEQVRPNPNTNVFTRYSFNEPYMNFSPEFSVGRIIIELFPYLQNGMSTADLPRTTLLDKIVYTWVKYKRVDPVRPSNSPTFMKQSRQNVSVYSRELAVFCSVYWSCLANMIENKELRGVVLGRPPTVFFEEMHASDSGYYRRDRNTVALNMNRYSSEGLLRGLAKARVSGEFDPTYLTTDPNLIHFFSTSEPLCIFIHEVTHAVLSEDTVGCRDCFHSWTPVRLNGGPELNFYDAGLEMYLYACAEYGLFDDYYEQLKVHS